INAPLMLVFPDCAALASSAPVSVAEMQTLIEPAEALARGAIRPGARLLLRQRTGAARVPLQGGLRTPPGSSQRAPSPSSSPTLGIGRAKVFRISVRELIEKGGSGCASQHVGAIRRPRRGRGSKVIEALPCLGTW